MCNIMIFKPMQMLPRDMLRNCCFNNWHSYGLVTRVDGMLDIKKKVPESGEVDPEEVIKLLEDNVEYERYLHVRHNTAGATTLENCHPFDVYYDPKTGEQVLFMHNGTMYSYKSQVYDEKTKKMVDDDSGPSDTKNFVDQVLIPYTSACDFGGGRGDISHPLFQSIVKAHWPSTGGNKGLLISAKHGHFAVGDWVKVGDASNPVESSNNSYFARVERGPEFERRRLREAEKKKSTAITVSRTADGGYKADRKQISLLKDFKLCAKHDFALSDNLKNIANDWDVWSREGAIALGTATHEELKQLYSDEQTCMMMMDIVFTDYAKAVDELKKLEEKLKNATTLIATLKQEQKVG